MVYLAGLRSLYADVASRYEADVIPAFGPLASDLAAWIEACYGAYVRGDLFDPFDLSVSPLDAANRAALAAVTAIDIGTGSGILARHLAGRVGRVVGLDLSAEMLAVAAAQPSPAPLYVQADVHHLPLRPNRAHLIVSSFGLNTTTPKHSLRSIASALRPSGGLLIFQEWGATDVLTEIVHETIRRHTPDDFDYPDADLARFLDEPSAWYDHLQDDDDCYVLLKALGFGLVWAKEAAFVTVPITIEQFITYKLAWPSRRLPYEAMPPNVRAKVDRELRDQLREHSVDGAMLAWSPPLIRACAVKG